MTEARAQGLVNDNANDFAEIELLLLPGLNGSGRFHAPFLQALLPECRGHVLPLPNHGPQDYEYLCEHYSIYLTQRKCPVILLGESFSGPLVYELACKFPQQVKAVIFAASFVANPRPILSRVPAPAWLFKLGAKLPAWPLYRLAFRGQGERYWSLFMDERRQLNAPIWAARIAAVAARKTPQQVLVMPCLYLQADRDYLIRPSALKAIRSIAPKLTVAQLAGTHLILQTNPQACAAAVKQWLKQL